MSEKTEKMTVVLDIQGDVSNLKKSLDSMQSYFSKLSGDKMFTKGMKEELDAAQNSLKRLQNLAEQKKVSPIDHKEMKSAMSDLERSYNRILSKMNSNKFEGLQLVDSKSMRGFEKLESAYAKYAENIDNVKEKINKLRQDELDGISVEQRKTNLAKAAANERAEWAQRSKQSEEQFTKAASQQLAKQDAEYRHYWQERVNLEKNARGEIIKATNADAAVREIEEERAAVNLLVEDLRKIGIAIEGTPKTFEEIKTALTGLQTSEIKQATEYTENFIRTAEQGQQPLNGLAKAEAEVGRQFTNMGAAMKDVDQLRNRLMYFFGIGNAVQLFKRSIRSAYNTLKDLDEVMTETAVVTKFDISQMWEQLPTYVQRANELGLTIHDVYESMTLFYQQGLNTTEATELSTQALKMARIAGLDAATAVDRVTNALRGFNMELNEASATNIADVYSKLAAITASNVDEISTAMTKVASLANNANMSFENTAAFLAQIIESTRESAETAGTALKTVIARFSEVKKLYSEGELLGTDEEGEGIDVNRISTALRTAGLNLNEYLTGMKGLDQIFIDLAAKWDTLSIVQQRYIATQAAGSRQQSRFIALMSDYQRTLQLTEAAQNAAGASEEQYQKTLESLESKLNQLKNAWNEFTMNILNSGFLKGIIDFVRTLLNGINAITGKLPGMLKSFANLGVIFGSLKLGRTLLFGKQGLLGVVGNAFKGKQVEGIGHRLMQGILGGFVKSKAMANVTITKTVSDLAEQAAAAQAKAHTRYLASGEEDTVYLKNAAAVKIYNESLKELGITEQQHALILATKLDAEGQELAIRGLKAGVITEEDLATKNLTTDQLKQILTTKGVTLEKKKGIVASIQARLVTSLETGAMHKLLLATLGQTAADKAYTIAQNIANISAMAFLGIILAIIAAIALLIVAIVSVAKTIKSLSPDAQLKKTQEELKKINEELSETKEKTDNLKSAVDTFEELQEKVNHTVKGTQAWKEALAEANQQVLDLAEQYPELADKIIVGSNSQLTFEDGALDALYQAQIDQLNTLNNIYLVTQGIESSLKDETVVNRVEDTIRKSGYDNKDELLDMVDDVALALANGELTLDMFTANEVYGMGKQGEYVKLTQEGQEAAEKLGFDIENLRLIFSLFTGDMKSLIDYANINQDRTNTYQNIIDSVFAQSEELGKTNFAEAFSAVTNIDELRKKQAAYLSSPQGELALEGAYAQAGIIKQGGKFYQGKVDDDHKLTNEEAFTRAVNATMPDLIEKTATEFNNVFQGYNTEQQQFLNRLLTGTLTGMEAADLKKAAASYGIDDRDINFIANKLGTSTEALLQLAHNAADTRGEYERDFSNYGLNPEFMKNVSNDTMQVLLDHFQESFADSPGIAQMIYGHIIDAMENVPEDKQDDFIKAISSLTFGNLDSVLALQDTLKSFEIDGDFTSLINNISRLAQSTTEASTNLTGLYEIIEKIGNGETVFSDEEYKELLGFGANESDFMQDLEGNYIYIGENLGQLLADTTANAYDVQLQSYRNAIEKGDMATAEQNLVNMETLRQQQLTSDNYQQVQQGLGGVTEKELIAAASRYEELTDDIEKYRKAMQSADKEERTRATLVLRNAVLGKAQEKQFNNLTEAISENKDALLSGDEASQAYRDALGTVTKAAQEFFGEVVDDDFVSEHVDLFAQMAEGDVNALESIRDFIAQDLLASFEAPEGAMANVNEEYANLVNYLAQLDGSEFTVDGHMDDSEIVAKINALINSLIAAGATADQVKAVVEGMGYTIDWDIEYEQIPIYTNVNAKYDKEDAWTMDPSSGKTLDVLKGGKYISVPKPTMKVKSIGDNAGKNWTPPKASGGSGGSGGGGGGSEKNDIWENPYDELYNLTEKVNEALRDREKLERDYDRILKNRKATSQELINNSLAEISNLRHEIDLQRQLLTGRRKQLAALGSETHADSEGNLRSFNSWGVTKYASYNEKTGLIEIDWEGIDAITDTELGEAVEAYVSRVEELAGQIEDIQDTMEDMKDKIDEIKERNKDNYLELEQRVYDALVNQKQALIDEYQAISDSISESNNKIIDSLRESIDLERQIRDNTKTEEDLADKEARLAYLRRDTSGANQTEILKLEKELEEGRQSYQDKLIDQAIDKLDQENQRAADQREKQIQLMQDQLDWQASQGEFWKDTYTLLSTAFDENGNLKNNSELVKLLKEDDTFKGLSMFGQENWIEDMARTWLEAQEGLNNWRMQKAEEAGSLQLNGNGTKLTYKNGKWYDSKGNEYENVHWDAATQTYVGTKKAKTQVPKSNNNGGNNDPNPPKSEEPTTSAKGYIAGLPEKDYNQYTKEEVKKLQEGLLSLRDDGVIKFDIGDGGRGGFADGVYGNYTKNAVRALQTLLGSSYTSIGGVVDGLWGKKSRKAFLGSKWKAYKTGGLADFTGPAWLDGSLTNPEMVLNPQDTHNFLSLVDMLRNLAASGQTLNDMSFGDYLFNITVNAELNNDYDVDRLVDRLKDRISSEAQYRNINAMSRFR